MTSIDAIACLFLFFFLLQFCLFLMLSWIVRQFIRVLSVNAKEFRRESKFWNNRARREALLRKLEKAKTKGTNDDMALKR